MTSSASDSGRQLLLSRLASLVKKWFDSEYSSYPRKRIPLSVPSFDWQEVYGSLESLLSTKVTMGEKVRTFEDLFARYLGVKHAVMVNSGSSANLIAMSILSNPILGKNRLVRGDEVIVPAVTWSTSIFPVANVGAIPVLVDVDLPSFSIDLNDVEAAITKRTKALMIVHLLGFPARMDRVMRIAREHGLYVIEDACESHGAEFDGMKVGGIGDMGTFSFFFSHHISTIEGGMLVTNNDSFADLARSLRAHGWIRERRDRQSIAKRYRRVVDDRFLFVNLGYNLRPTEIQGAFGMYQLPKLDGFIRRRSEIASYWSAGLFPYSDYFMLPVEQPHSRCVWFGYPITIRANAPFSCKELAQHLESKGIETRPIMGGNMAQQPAMKYVPHRKYGRLRNSRYTMEHSFFIGIHRGINDKDKDYVLQTILDFVKKRSPTD